MIKSTTSHFNGYIYKIVGNANVHLIPYSCISILNLFISIFIIVEHIIIADSKYFGSSNTGEFIEINYIYLFYFLVAYSCALLIVFIVCKIMSQLNDFMRYSWIYGLFILQAISTMYILSLVKCFLPGGWCSQENSNTHYKILIVILNVLMVIGIYFKNYAYYPFHSMHSLLSMHQQHITIILLCFRIVTITLSYLSFEFSEPIVLFAYFLIYWKSKKSGYNHQTIRNIWNSFYTILIWSKVSEFIVLQLHKQLLIGQNKHSIVELYFQFWGCTMPFFILPIFFNVDNIHKKSWRKLFEKNSHSLVRQVKKQTIFLLCSQVHEIILKLKKSELKYKHPLYQKLIDLVIEHCKGCESTKCELQQLSNIYQKEKQDSEYFESKFFNKMLSSILEYCREILESLHFNSPHNLQISIQLAAFELFALMQKQQGIILYNENIGKDSLASHEKYAVYFLKRKVDDLFIGAKKIAEINTNQIQSQFRQKLQISVAKLSDFWYFLSQPKCNLIKLYELANELFPLKMGVENDWERVKTFKSINSYTLYAKYLLKLFNDKMKGIEILQEIKKIEHEQLMKTQIELDDKLSEIVEQNGIIFLEFGGKKSGIIFQANVNAEKIFGYMKGELIDQKVNDIMPKVYADNHDQILERYQETSESTMMNKQRHVWGKSKDGYLIPIILLIKPILNFYSGSSTSEVYASVRRQIYMKESACLVLNPEHQIINISSSALKMFPSLKKLSEKNKIDIMSIIPNFAECKKKIMDHNQNCEIVLTRTIPIYAQSSLREITEEIILLMHLQPINIKIKGKIGYIVKLTKCKNSKLETLQLPDNQDQRFEFSIKASENNIRQSGIKRSSNLNERRLGSNPATRKQNNLSKEKAQKIIKSIVYHGQPIVDDKHTGNIKHQPIIKFKQFLKVKEEEKDEKKKVVWDANIRTKRLYDGLIRQMREQQSISDLDKNFDEASDNSDHSNLYQIKPSQLNDVIQNKTNNPNTMCLKVITFFILLLCCILCIAQLLLENTQRSKLAENMNRIKQINDIQSQVLLLKFYTIVFSHYSASSGMTENNTENFQYLSTEVSLGTWNKNFQTDIKQLDQLISSFVFNQNTTVSYQDSSEDTYYSGFALNKLISEANNIKNDNLNRQQLLSSQQSSSFFLIHNTINGLYQGLSKEQLHQIDSFAKNSEDLYKLRFLFLVVFASICFIVLIAINWVYRKAINKKAQILQIFFQIPRMACTQVHKECQRFIFRLSNEQQMENESEIEEDLNSNHQNSKKKKRRFIGQESSTKGFSLMTIVFFLLLTGFFLFKLIEGLSQKQIFSQLSEGAITCYSQQSKIASFQNFMNSYIDNSDLPINGSLSNLDTIKSIRQQLIENSENRKVMFLKLFNILESQFEQKILKLMFSDFCEYSSEGQDCLTIINLQKNGLNSVQNTYLLHLKQKYEVLANGQQLQTLISEEQLSQQFFFYEAYKMGSRRLCQYLQSSITLFFQGLTNQAMYQVIIVCLIAMIVVWIFWYKYYTNLQGKIKATQYILTFIPANIININPKISKYLRQNYIRK